MSTKIYNAFKFHGTFDDLIPFLTEVRSDVMGAVKDELSNCTFDSFSEFASMLKNQMPIESSVCIYLHDKNIYLHFFLPGIFGYMTKKSMDLLDRWNSRMSDFHYQNQVDRPENISEDEYNTRRIIWDEIFEDEDRPGYAGFVWNLLGESDLLTLWCNHV